jgi:hypothetical protein
MAESGRCLNADGNISKSHVDCSAARARSYMSMEKMGRTLVLTIALIMAAIGIAVTGLICLSGRWGIGHMWPVLMLSVPLLVTGIYMFRLGLGVKSSSGTS